MKILVVGAGVLGSIYAAKLALSGQEITLLARGKRLLDLRTHGLVVEDALSGERTACSVRLVEKLSAEEPYDLALVVVRKNQLGEVLEMLAKNPNIPVFVFLFNNAAGPNEMVRAVGRERVVVGFPGGGGQRDGQVVRYLLSGRKGQPTTLGELDGSITPRLLRIADVLETAGFPVAISPDMDAWLKTHFAIIGPVAGAIYAAGGDGKRLANTPDALVLLVRAARESLRILHALGIPTTPSRFKILEWVPEPILVALLKSRVGSPLFDLAAIRHAMSARDEMSHLAGEFHTLVHLTGCPAPALDELNRYMDLDTPPMPEGSANLKLRWHGVMVLGALVSSFMLAVYLLIKRVARGGNK